MQQPAAQMGVQDSSYIRANSRKYHISGVSVSQPSIRSDENGIQLHKRVRQK